MGDNDSDFRCGHCGSTNPPQQNAAQTGLECKDCGEAVREGAKAPRFGPVVPEYPDES